MGADVDNSAPTAGLPSNAGSTLNHFRARPTFLMVGTLEPRKGHVQTLDAFEQLWQSGDDINLVIVGKQGWMVEELFEFNDKKSAEVIAVAVKKWLHLYQQDQHPQSCNMLWLTWRESVKNLTKVLLDGL